MVSNVFRSVVQKNAFCDAGMPVATTSYTVLGEPTSCSVSLFGWTKANIVVMALVHLCRWCLCARGRWQSRSTSSFIFQLYGSSRVDWADVKVALVLKHCALWAWKVQCSFWRANGKASSLDLYQPGCMINLTKSFTRLKVRYADETWACCTCDVILCCRGKGPIA